MDVTLLNSLEGYVQKQTQILRNQIHDEGNFAPHIDSVFAYHQLPLLLSQCGFTEEANRVLHYIDKTFFDENHLYIKKPGEDKPVHEGITRVASYIGMAAHQCGRFNISYKINNHLRHFYHPDEGAFTACAPFDHLRAVLDFNASSLLGYFFLMFGDVNKAKRAGNFLQRVQSLQTHMNELFYLRIGDDGKLITSFAKDDQTYCAILTGKAHQNYDAIGLACRFLAKLHLATQDENYLRLSQSLFEYALSNPHVNHTITLSAAILANITKEQRYQEYLMENLTAILEKEIITPDSIESYQTTIHQTLMLKEIVAEFGLL